MPTKIEWVTNQDGSPGETWNPMTGCTPVSEACEHCYAERMARRFPIGCRDCESHKSECVLCDARELAFAPTFHPDRLDKPLHWRKPRRIFVNSMSDLFHEAFTDEQIAKVLSVAVAAPQHTYMVLTKRPERMREYMQGNVEMLGEGSNAYHFRNLWLGVTAENQQRADERIPILLDTPAAVRFVSIEPMLGPVDFRKVPNLNRAGSAGQDLLRNFWVILGGETGPGARPMYPEWALDVYRQCKAAGVPFFFKRWGSRYQKRSFTKLPAGEFREMQATREYPKVKP